MFIDLEAVDKKRGWGYRRRGGEWEIENERGVIVATSPREVYARQIVEGRHQPPEFDTVYLVICEHVSGNEPGQVLSIWTDKEAAERERDELRKRIPINSAWAYEVNDAPLNKSGVVGLN